MYNLTPSPISVEKLYDNQTWIHGDPNVRDINLTIFIITIEDEQLKYTLESVLNLNPKYPVYVNVIKNISPTNKAYNEMRLRCKTKYFCQLDDDMILIPNAIELFYNTKDNSEKCFLNIYRLYDSYIGVERKGLQRLTLYGTKFYNQTIMCKFATNSKDTVTSSVDRLWHEPILENGFTINRQPDAIGYHEKYRSNFNLILKFSKFINNILNPYTPFRESDTKHIIEKVFKNKDYEKLLSAFSNHIQLIVKCNPKEFKSNLNMLEKVLSPLVKKLKLNNLQYTWNIDSFFSVKTYKLKNVQDYFSMIGVINRLANNYAYSFDKYPYELKRYFNYFYRPLKVFIISHQLPNNGGSSTNSYVMGKYLNKNPNLDVYNIFIDEAKYLNEFDTSKYDKSRQFFLINDENITESISNIIYCCDVIIFRYPQVSSKELNYFDFRKIRNLSKNIISVFGGGYQNLPNFNISKITKADKLSIQDSNKKYEKILSVSDYIFSNSDNHRYIFKYNFKEKYIDSIPFTYINKNTYNIVNYNYDHNWKKRKYDIIFISSSLIRECKNVPLFFKIIKQFPKLNVVVIGKNYDNPAVKKIIKNIDTTNIKFVGFVENVDYYLKQSKLLILTSEKDLSPNIVTEAVNEGCNVLFPNHCGWNTFYKKNSIINNYNDLDEWVVKVKNLLKKNETSFKNNDTIDIENKIDKFKEFLYDLNIDDKRILLDTDDKSNLNIFKKYNMKLFILNKQTDNISFENNYYYINDTVAKKWVNKFDYFLYSNINTFNCNNAYHIDDFIKNIIRYV
jgi:hypothetical protein